jgi:GNAT superfamily N-acetyltransferase
MYWRVPSTGAYWQAHKGRRNRNSFKSLVERGLATGVLAFSGAEAIGWSSVGPRVDFPYLERARKIPTAIDVKTWSVTCFYILKEFRHCGVAGRLVEAAVALARSHGATTLEAYPSVAGNPDSSIPDVFAHTGVPSLFEKAGFEFAAEIGARRLYRRTL